MWKLKKTKTLKPTLPALICWRATNDITSVVRKQHLVAVWDRCYWTVAQLAWGRVWARGRCRISPPRFLAECCKRQLNQGSFVLLYFRLSTFSYLYWVCLSVFSCTALFVSISQVIGCEDRLRNDLYCVELGVKLYCNQTTASVGRIGVCTPLIGCQVPGASGSPLMLPPSFSLLTRVRTTSSWRRGVTHLPMT